MKKTILLLLLSSFLFTGCKVLGPVEYSTAIDYNKIENATGIRLSESNSVSYPHTTLATVYGYSRGGYVKGGYVDADLQKAIIQLCKRASELGANEIINFSFQRVTEDIKSGRYSYSCSGMAIRKQ